MRSAMGGVLGFFLGIVLILVAVFWAFPKMVAMGWLKCIGVEKVPSLFGKFTFFRREVKAGDDELEDDLGGSSSRNFQERATSVLQTVAARVRPGTRDPGNSDIMNQDPI